MLRVVVYNEAGEVIQRWESKGRWEGELPQKYTATRGGGGWTWDNTDGSSVRVDTNKDGRGGLSAEAWAKTAGKKIVVYAYAASDVTLDDDAEESDKAPGHAKDPKAGGDGSTTRVNPDGKETGSDDNKSRDGGAQGAGSQEGKGDGRKQGGDGSDTETEGEIELGTDEDGRIADEFERDLGIDPDDEDLEGETTTGATTGGKKPGGEGASGGDLEGRTGDDTGVGGTGPGGDKARADGQGKGAETGGNGGSAAGGKDGQEGGAEGGMFGGKGKPGDDGVPSAIGLFGGLIGIPAALKGLVEVALIIANGNITGAGANLFRQGLGKVASAVAARREIAKAARRAAVKETKAALKAIQADKVKGRIWNAATKAEREAATRRIYWELQRTYFQGYLTAARRAKSDAKTALRKTPRHAGAEQRLKSAELAEEAAAAPPVAGRLPQNHEFAGKQFPTERLPPAFRQKGLRFSEAGYPDFSPYAQTLPNGQKSVQITYTGSRSGDFAAANAKVGYRQTPEGFRWHHHEDMKTMLLVPKDLHELVKHTGGVATYKHSSGVARYD